MSRSKTLKLLKKFKEKDADKYGILLLGVFGSVARDEATNKSDVDIVLKTKTPDPYNIVHIKDELEILLDKHVDIVRSHDRMNSFLKKRIEKEAIYV